MRFSLIMPVYNAEATLSVALQSILAQTTRDFEVVFIDDGSTDHTAAILNDFVPYTDFPCRIVRQENRGVAAARNRGLREVRGEYIAFIDADDTLEPHALEIAKALLDRHLGTVDIVGWDWTLDFEKKGRYMRQADYGTPLQAIKNLMSGTMRWNLWMFLVRREMVVRHNICFLDGVNMGEDMQFMLKAFCAADSVVQIHEALYRYNALSESSLSRQFSDVRRAEITANLEEAVSAIYKSVYAEALEPYVNDLKLFLKRPLLISGDRRNYELWYQWFPEANACATANKALPWRTRWLQGMAARRCWVGVKFYYLLVNQVVYGVIYR